MRSLRPLLPLLLLSLGAFRASALGGKRLLVAGKGYAHLLIGAKASQAGKQVSVLVSDVDEAPKLFSPALAKKLEFLPLKAFDSALLERMDSVVVAPDAPATKGLMKSVLNDVAKMKNPGRLQLLLTSFVGVERVEKTFDEAWRANFVRGGDILRAKVMEDYVQETNAGLGCSVTFVRHGKLLGGGGVDGFGEESKFYNTFPEYNQLLTERMHDNGQCDIEVAAGDTLPLEKTNRKALANACVAALDLPPMTFGVVSKEGSIETGGWPGVKEWKGLLKDLA